MRLRNRLVGIVMIPVIVTAAIIWWLSDLIDTHRR